MAQGTRASKTWATAATWAPLCKCFSVFQSSREREYLKDLSGPMCSTYSSTFPSHYLWVCEKKKEKRFECYHTVEVSFLRKLVFRLLFCAVSLFFLLCDDFDSKPNSSSQVLYPVNLICRCKQWEMIAFLTSIYIVGMLGTYREYMTTRLLIQLRISTHRCRCFCHWMLISCYIYLVFVYFWNSNYF